MPDNKSNTYEIEIIGTTIITVEFALKDEVAINKTEKSDYKYGIKFIQNIVSDKAEIGLTLPNDERIIDTKITVFDMTGNLVFNAESVMRNSELITWNLRNKSGKTVANGSYLVIAEVKSVSGNVYRYSAKLGVKR